MLTEQLARASLVATLQLQPFAEVIYSHLYIHELCFEQGYKEGKVVLEYDWTGLLNDQSRGR